MLVSIEEIFPECSKSKVVFSTRFGVGIAFWIGDISEVESIYTVEIEIPDILEWGESIYEASGDLYSIETVNNIVYFRGRLESITEDDGCYIVRVGDSVILLETKGVPIPIGSYLDFRTERVILYNNNL